MIKSFLRTVVCAIILMTISVSIFSQDAVVGTQEAACGDIPVDAQVCDAEKTFQENNFVEAKPLSYGERLTGISPEEMDRHCYASFPSYIFFYLNLDAYWVKPDELISSVSDKSLVTGRYLQRTAWSDDIIQKIGLNPENITLLEAAENKFAFAIGREIIGLESTLMQGSSEGAFILGHEAGHLKQDCFLQSMILAIALPFITHYGLTWYDKCVQYITTKFEQKFQLDEQSRLFKGLESFKQMHNAVATSWVTKAALSIYLYILFQQHLEKDADLRSARALGSEGSFGGLCSLTKQQGNVEALHQFYLDKASHPGPILERAKYFLKSIRFSAEGNDRLDIMHPSLTTRIHYLNEIHHRQWLAALQAQFAAHASVVAI